MKHLLILIALFAIWTLTSCNPEKPGEENEEEVFTDVVLTFNNSKQSFETRAVDPDGEGPLPLQIVDTIRLIKDFTYNLDIKILNSLNNEVISEDIKSGEADEHQLFFSWTDGLFVNPSGNGNIDRYDDEVDYTDSDANGRPLGLTTDWRTATSPKAGSFRVLLKHQPDGLKTMTSGSTDGDTDVDITFNIRVD